MRFLGKCASQKSALLLTTGKSADLTVAKKFEFHRLKGSIDRLTVLFSECFPPSQGLISPHFHHSAHCDREIPIDHRALRQIRYFRDGRAPIMAMESHRASFNRHKTNHCLEKGGFAGAV